MSPQMTFIRGRIVAFVALVLLFSTVRFHMLPQMTFKRGCKVAFVVFVLLFSTVRFHMLPQMTFIRECIVAFVAFILLFSTVRFHIWPQMSFTSWKRNKTLRQWTTLLKWQLSLWHRIVTNVTTRQRLEGDWWLTTGWSMSILNLRTSRIEPGLKLV